MDSINSNLIGNLFSSLIIEKLHLDSRYTVLFTTLISSFLIKASIPSLPPYWYLYCFAPGLFWYFYYYNTKAENNNYTKLKTYCWEDISLLRFMMEKHPEFYTKEYDMIVGNPEARSLDDIILPDAGTKIEFHDKIHNVKGYISAESSEYVEGASDKSVQKKAFYILLNLEKGSGYNCDTYMKKLRDYRTEYDDNEDELVLSMIKIMGKKDSGGNKEESYQHAVRLYKGPKKNYEERYQKYIKSYFSKNRDVLWNYIYNVHFHPEKFSIFGQEARCNMLIYGPPGSGKSTFVYRLAMALGRHIVSVDITSISSDRTEVYRTIQNANIDGWSCCPDKYIVLLEEFDITVKHLKEKNKRPNLSEFLKSYGPKTQTDSKEDMTLLYSRSTREFELEDLLEILQGPVPIKGSIIIATTNKYEEIHELCPALFRPGRLTPVKFDYMDWKSLQDMTYFYFKRPLDIEETEIRVATSEIVELALDSCLYENDCYERFRTGLVQRLNSTQPESQIEKPV